MKYVFKKTSVFLSLCLKQQSQMKYVFLKKNICFFVFMSKKYIHCICPATTV